MSRNIIPIFEDTEVYPVEASATGNNAYYHHCDQVGHTAPYASCLKHVADRKNGKLDSIFSDCSAAIGRKDCPAIKMCQQEKDAGKALFFVNRAKQREFYRGEGESLEIVKQPKYEPPVFARRTTSAPSPRQTPAAPVPSPAPAATTSSGNIYADAINAALKPGQAPVNSKTLPATMGKSPLNNKNLTPLEMARLMVGATQ
jgi:hypothetical protein